MTGFTPEQEARIRALVLDETAQDLARRIARDRVGLAARLEREILAWRARGARERARGLKALRAWIRERARLKARRNRPDDRIAQWVFEVEELGLAPLRPDEPGDFERVLVEVRALIAAGATGPREARP